jgi:hypothetical protein
MATREPSRKQALREAIRSGELRALQILQLALMSGVTLFAAVVVALSIVARPAMTGQALPASTLRLMVLVHVAVAILAWGLGPLLQSIVHRQTDAAGAAGPLTGLRQGTMTRLALLEAPAILGLVICLLAQKGGVLRAQPLYWLNALSAAAFVVYGALSFPTQARVEDWLTAP